MTGLIQPQREQPRFFTQQKKIKNVFLFRKIKKNILCEMKEKRTSLGVCFRVGFLLTRFPGDFPFIVVYPAASRAACRQQSDQKWAGSTSDPILKVKLDKQTIPHKIQTGYAMFPNTVGT